MDYLKSSLCFVQLKLVIVMHLESETLWASHFLTASGIEEVCCLHCSSIDFSFSVMSVQRSLTRQHESQSNKCEWCISSLNSFIQTLVYLFLCVQNGD